MFVTQQQRSLDDRIAILGRPLGRRACLGLGRALAESCQEVPEVSRRRGLYPSVGLAVLEGISTHPISHSIRTLTAQFRGTGSS